MVCARVRIRNCLSNWKQVIRRVEVLPAISVRINLGVAKAFPRGCVTALQYVIVIRISAFLINRLGYT